ncbi:hypothetical protein NIE79_004723 [Micromonospora sp. NIE79]|uniref:Uncharacterized protein n=1 Tax=Micromonospora trifolii TaxID=2911208 RepID=A0ABS9N882_9ACTN|nr:hypothetical protein [Micromonospora trifolii]MCG5446156.1 hypothetical protein [Micromonospora trifolii]
MGAGAGVEQQGDDGGVAGAAAVGGPLDGALLLGGEGVGFAGAGHAGPFDLQLESGADLVEKVDGGEGLVHGGRAGLGGDEVPPPGGDGGLGADLVDERVLVLAGVLVEPGGVRAGAGPVRLGGVGGQGAPVEVAVQRREGPVDGRVGSAGRSAMTFAVAVRATVVHRPSYPLSAGRTLSQG